jgi:hypothetical protein
MGQQPRNRQVKKICLAKAWGTRRSATAGKTPFQLDIAPSQHGRHTSCPLFSSAPILRSSAQLGTAAPEQLGRSPRRLLGGESLLRGPRAARRGPGYPRHYLHRRPTDRPPHSLQEYDELGPCWRGGLRQGRVLNKKAKHSQCTEVCPGIPSEANGR